VVLQSFMAIGWLLPLLVALKGLRLDLTT
jgi:hypothetical protein